MQYSNPVFIPGPTNLPERIRRAIQTVTEDQRSPRFPELTLPLFDKLKKVFRTETGHVLVFPGSGTGGWESAITNTLSPGDKVLTARFGQFSQLWSEMCGRFGLDVTALDVEWGKGVPLDDYRRILADDTTHEIKAVFACHNETATGVTSDIAGVRKVLDEVGHPALLFVDGVSSVGSLEFHMEDWGVDLAVSGSQKGFMMPTGLAIVGVSQKAIDASKSAGLTRSYFHFDAMLRTNKDGYFPYTPNVQLLHGLSEACDMLLEEGLEAVWARHHRMAEGVRRGITEGWNLDVCAASPEWYSDTVTAIRVPKGFDAAQMIRIAYDRYQVSYGTGLARLAGKVFRIGHLGLISELQLLSGLAGAEMAMRDIGIDIEPGSGVAAASEYYRQTAAPVAVAEAASR
ncbi:MAG: aminotransferase class V-fold PLP-dependent enzyme [Rhodospirillales bacterium]